MRPDEIIIDIIEGFLTCLTPYLGLLFLKELKDGLIHRHDRADEFANVLNIAQETLKFFVYSRRWHFDEYFELIKVYFNSCFTDREAKDLSFYDIEIHLYGLETSDTATIVK